MPAAKKYIDQFCHHGAPSTMDHFAWGYFECAGYANFRFVTQAPEVLDSLAIKMVRVVS
jgi:hypothetical protein